MVNEFEQKEEFIKKYKGQVGEVLIKAIKEAREYLGENTYIRMWNKTTQHYIGNDFVFSLATHGTIFTKKE